MRPCNSASRAQAVRLEDFDLKVVGGRDNEQSDKPVIEAAMLKAEQLESVVDLNPDLNDEQREKAKALLWDFRD